MESHMQYSIVVLVYKYLTNQNPQVLYSFHDLTIDFQALNLNEQCPIHASIQYQKQFVKSTCTPPSL